MVEQPGALSAPGCSTNCGREAGEPTTTLAQRGTTREEATEILRRVWLGWFEGIHTSDEDRIRQVVATRQKLEDARRWFGTEYQDAPTLEGIVLFDTEVLLDRPDCLVVSSGFDVTAFRGEGHISSMVTVMWPDDAGDWRIAATWKYPGDLWIQDCDLRVRP